MPPQASRLARLGRGGHGQVQVQHLVSEEPEHVFHHATHPLVLLRRRLRGGSLAHTPGASAVKPTASERQPGEHKSERMGW